MSRSQKFMYSTLTSALYQIIVMLVGFILPKVMLSCYGSEINGIVTSITQFISYFKLVEAGLGSAAIYALYKPLADNNHDKVNSVVSATNQYYVKSGILFIILLAGLAFFYPALTETEMLSDIQLFCLVLVIGVNGIIDFFTLGKYRAILGADQRTYILSIASILYYVLNTAIVVILSYKGLSVTLVRVVAVLAVFIRTLFLMLYCRKSYPYLDCSTEPDFKALDKRWDALILQILDMVQKGFPVILATFFTTFAEVSIYSVYNMVLIGIMGILDIFTSGISASFGNIIANGEKENLKKVYTDFEAVYYVLITVTYSAAMLLIIPFIWIYTNGISDAEYVNVYLGILFVLNGYLYNIKTPHGMMVISAGLYRETRWQTITQAVIIALFGVILAPGYGLIGIMVASCISNLYRDIDLCFFIPKYVTKLPVRNTVKRIVISVLSMIVATLGMNYCLTRMNVMVRTWVGWLECAIFITLICCILVISMAIIFDRKAFVSSMNRIKNTLWTVHK